jgi:hypothetical protein
MYVSSFILIFVIILSGVHMQYVKFENLNADGIAAPSSGFGGHSQAFVCGVKACKGRKFLAVRRKARVRGSY